MNASPHVRHSGFLFIQKDSGFVYLLYSSIQTVVEIHTDLLATQPRLYAAIL